MKAEIFITVHRPVSEVFEFITTHANEPRWNNDLDHVKDYSADDWGVGSTCEMVFQTGDSVPITVTAYTRNQLYAFRSTDAASRYEFTDKGDRTEVRFTTEVQLHGLMVRTVMRSSIHRRIKQKLQENFAKLKQVLERPDN